MNTVFANAIQNPLVIALGLVAVYALVPFGKAMIVFFNTSNDKEKAKAGDRMLLAGIGAGIFGTAGAWLPLLRTAMGI